MPEQDSWNGNKFAAAITCLNSEYVKKSRAKKYLEEKEKDEDWAYLEEELQQIRNAIALLKHTGKPNQHKESALNQYRQTYQKGNTHFVETNRTDGNTALSIFVNNNPKNRLSATFIFNEKGELIGTE